MNLNKVHEILEEYSEVFNTCYWRSADPEKTLEQRIKQIEHLREQTATLLDMLTNLEKFGLE